MADETTGTGAGNQPGIETQSGTPASLPGESTGQETRTFTQDDVNRINAEHRREAEKARKRAEAAEAKLAEQEKQNMSEQEKAIAAAKEEARKESDSTWQKRLLKTELRARLSARGKPPEWAEIVLATQNPESEDDLDKAIAACEEGFEWFRGGAGTGPAPSTGSPDGSPPRGEGYITAEQARNPTFYAKNPELVETALRKGLIRG